MDYTTPIVPCHGMDNSNEIFIKRDDLLPFSFGGNKVRIAEEFFDDMEAKGKNCMVGYGNARSNLCRVLANMSYQRYGAGGYCHIVSPADSDGSRVVTSNSRIVESCGAVIHECSKTNVADTVTAVMNECEKNGYKPYYIYGDCFGNGNEAVPVRAYAKAYTEIGSGFDYIFLATGTGMTQAGLIAGKAINGGSEKIVGISISRTASAECQVMRKYLDEYYQSEGISHSGGDEINVVDEYLEGGYGKYSQEVLVTIRDMFLLNGIPMDTTYTGKAFHGMLQYIKKNNICGKRILFIHTGGTPLFFDKRDEIFSSPYSYSQVCDFIRRIDRELPTPLSDRVNLSEYSYKLFKTADICFEEEDGNIVSMVAGYTENTVDNIAYVTLVGTLPESRGRGLAEKLMREFAELCRKKGLRGVNLHTEKRNKSAEALYRKLGYTDYKIKDEPRPEDLHLVLWL